MPKLFLVGGEWRASSETLDIVFPYDNSTTDTIYIAQDSDLEDAITAAQRGFDVTRRLSSRQRAGILHNLYQLMSRRADEMIDLMIMESGKTGKVARAEFARACQTVTIGSEEAKRIQGEVIDLGWTMAGEHHRGFVARKPIGIVLGITPFNYPINLACHKIAPAIAAGNALIIKPPEIAPLSSLLLAELILEAGYPPEALSMLPCPGARAEQMAVDPRIAMLSFTGSAPVGWMLKNKAGQKKVTLELGGNAPVIVHEDADMRLAVAKTAAGAFTNAGQSCISVQRILIHQAVYEAFCDDFLTATAALKWGDPRDDETDIGPMINARAAHRAEMWVQEAVQGGASILMSGERQGAMFPATVMADVHPHMKVCALEVFAPVVTLTPYTDWNDAIAIANQSDFGLQAGVFTRDIGRAMHAWDDLEVGGVLINEVPTFRVDHMPYGGIKGSGLGREGVKYAIEDMTEPRLLVLYTP